MRYETETTKLNDALKNYAWAIIINSPHKNKWLEETLKLFVNQFIVNEINIGRIKAELKLQENLAIEYTMT